MSETYDSLGKQQRVLFNELWGRFEKEENNSWLPVLFALSEHANNKKDEAHFIVNTLPAFPSKF